MTKLIKVKDHPHLYRDEDTGAIINYDTLSYNQRIKKIEDQKTQKEELDHMKFFHCLPYILLVSEIRLVM